MEVDVFIVTLFLLLASTLSNNGQLIVPPPLRTNETCSGVDKMTGLTPDEQKVLCKVFKDYHPMLRPVRNWSLPVRVGVSLALNQIFELDERNQMLITNTWIDQEWTDEYMVWSPEEFGISVIRIPARYLWLPDIMLYNNGADYVNRLVQTRAMVKYDGTVFYPTPVKLYSSCTIDVTYFPFDVQTCWLKFGSWTHDLSQVDIYGRVEDIDISRFVHNGEWEVADITHRRHLVHYSCCIELYSDLTFYIRIKRKVLYYVINVFFPSFIMSSLTLLTFLMPPDSGEKLTLGITVLLSFSVFMLSVTEKLPETSEYIPLISIYLCVVLSMLCFSIISTICVLSIYYQRPSPLDDLTIKRPPRLARRFSHLFARNQDKRRYGGPPDNSIVSHAIRGAEEAMRSRYTKSRRRREAVVFPEKNSPLLPRRTPSTLSNLLRRESVFNSIKNFLEAHEQQPADETVNASGSADDATHSNVKQEASAQLPLPPMRDAESEETTRLHYDAVQVINRLVSRSARDARLERVVLEWKLFSAAVDRLLFCLFMLLTGSCIIVLLVGVPALHEYYLSIGRHVSRAGAVEYPEANSSGFSWLFYNNNNNNGQSGDQQDDGDANEHVNARAAEFAHPHEYWQQIDTNANKE